MNKMRKMYIWEYISFFHPFHVEQYILLNQEFKAREAAVLLWSVL